MNRVTQSILAVFFVFLMLLILPFSIQAKKNKDHDGRNGCNQQSCGCNSCHTPTPRPTPTPCVTPTPTPTSTSTPTPEETSTPQPEPTVTPDPGGGNTGGGDGGSPSAPGCQDPKPSGNPILASVVKIGADSVKLTWWKVSGANHYSVEYGLESKNYIYSVTDTGDTDNYVVNGLSNGCFAVRAWNGCGASDLSNEICIGQSSGVGGQVLGASTLADTGSVKDDLFGLTFILASILCIFGIRKAAPRF